MTTLTMGKVLGDVLKHEEDSRYSREEVTVLAGDGSDREPVLGEVVGKQTVGAVTATPDEGNAGDGTITAVTAGAQAVVGDYSIVAITAPDVVAAVPTVVLDGGNTGDGDIDTLTAGASAQIGNYEITAITAPNTPNTTGTSAPFAINAGNGVMGAITTGANVKAGTYRLTILDPVANAGPFELEDPDGIAVGTGVVAGAFTLGDHLLFTLADGSTDFIAGEGFTIVVGTTGDGGSWSVVAPDGSTLPNAIVGTAYASEQINFTIDDGGVNWIAGDSAVITVAATGAGGSWSVTAPNGSSLPPAIVGTAYVSEQVNFTINDGAADWEVGDSAVVAVAAGNGKVVALDVTAVTGAQVAAGFMAAAITAPNGSDIQGLAIVRDATYADSEVTWPDGFSAGQIATGTAQLKALGILSRQGV